MASRENTGGKSGQSPAAKQNAPTTASPTTTPISSSTATATAPPSAPPGVGQNDWMLAGVRASNEKLRNEIKKLKRDLETERKNIKELFVLHQGDLRQVRQQEQDRAQALLCDLKTKMNQEKHAELNKQKEKLSKEHEVEVTKLKKEHHENVWKISTDKKKEKEQVVKNLWDSKKTEDQRNASLQAELGKITQELHDVRSEKLRLEMELSTLTKSDKQKNVDLKRLAEEHEREVQRIRNENRREVKRILEEVKSKEKQMNVMQKELGSQVGEMMQTQLEKESLERRLENWKEIEEEEASKRTNESQGRSGSQGQASKIPVLKKTWNLEIGGDESKNEEKKEGGQETNPTTTTTKTTTTTTTKRSEEVKEQKARVPGDGNEAINGDENVVNDDATTEKRTPSSEEIIVVRESSSDKKSSKTKSKIPVLCSTPIHSRSSTPGDPFSETEDLNGDGFDDVVVEGASASTAPLAIEAANKSLEIPKLSSRWSWRSRPSASSNVSVDSGCLSASYLGTSPVGVANDAYPGSSPRGGGHLPTTADTAGRDSSEDLLDSSSCDTTASFDEAHQKKMKKRRQRMSLSPAHKIPKIMTSSIDSIEEREEDDVEEDVDRLRMQEQQRLVIERQKSDLSRLRAVSLTNDRLLREIGALKERIFELEGEKMKLADRLLEIREENEDMEFRLLEFEQSRMSPASRKTPQHVDDAVLSDEGVAVRCNRLSTKYHRGQISAKELALIEREREIDAIEFRLDELGDRLHKIKHSSDYGFSEDDVETIAMSRKALTLASKRIRASNESIAAMNSTIDELADVRTLLEKENVELRREASMTKPSPEIVDELEEMKRTMEEVRGELKTTKDALNEYREMEAKWKRKFEGQRNVENLYQDQIKDLKKKVESAEMGRDYESKLWKEKLQEITEKEALVESLRFQLNEIAELDSKSNAENGNQEETTRRLTEQVVSLKNHIEECEATEQNLLAEIERLKRRDNEEIESLKEQCQLLETRQNKLKEENESLNNNIDDYANQLLKSQEAVGTLRRQLDNLDEELKDEHRRPMEEEGASSDDKSNCAKCEENDSAREEQISILMVQLDDLRKELAVYEEKLGDVRAENIVLSRNNEELIHTLDEEKITFGHERETLKQEIRFLHNRIRSKEDQLRDLTREFSPDCEKTTSSPRRGSSFRRQKSRSRSPIAGVVKSKLSSSTPEVETLGQLSIEVLREKVVKEFEEREANLKKESEEVIADLKAQVKSLESKIELCQLKEMSIMERVQELEVREKDLMDQLRNYRLTPSEVEQLKEELQTVKEEKNNLLKQVGELETFLADTNAKFVKALEEKETAEGKLRLIEKKLVLMEESEERNAERIEELETSEKNMMEISQDNLELKEDVLILRRRVDELESIRQSLQDQLWEFYQIERDLKDEIHQLNTNQVDKDQLKMMDEKISSLQISEKNLSARNKELEKTEQMLRSRLAPVEHLDPKMIVKMKNQISSLEKAEKHLKKYIRELEDSQKCLGSENKELLVESDRLRTTVNELRSTEKQLVDKIFELEEIENHLQEALVQKDHRGSDRSFDDCETLNDEILKMQYESSILIFQATMKEKDLELEHERGLKIVAAKENDSLKNKIESLQSDMKSLQLTEAANEEKLKEAEKSRRQLSSEVETLKSEKAAAAEKDADLESTIRKMEDSLHKSAFNAEREAERASVLENQLDEKAQLIAEIQALNRSLSRQVEDYKNDIFDLKYVISEQQPKVAMLKEKDAKIVELEKQNEFLSKEIETGAFADANQNDKIARTRSLDLKTASIMKDHVKKNDEQRQQQQQQQQQQQPKDLTRSSTFILETSSSPTTTKTFESNSPNHPSVVFPEIQPTTTSTTTTTPTTLPPTMMMEFDISSDNASITSSNKSANNSPKTTRPSEEEVVGPKATSMPTYTTTPSTSSPQHRPHHHPLNRRSTSMSTIEDLRKKNPVLTLYYSTADLKGNQESTPTLSASSTENRKRDEHPPRHLRQRLPHYATLPLSLERSLSHQEPKKSRAFEEREADATEEERLDAEAKTRVAVEVGASSTTASKRKSRSASIPASLSDAVGGTARKEVPIPPMRKRRKSSQSHSATSMETSPVRGGGGGTTTPTTSLCNRGGSPRPNRFKNHQQQQRHQQRQLDQDASTEESLKLVKRDSLACCFFVDLKEKKTSLGEDLDNRKSEIRNENFHAEKGNYNNVKSASLPSVVSASEEADPKDGGKMNFGGKDALKAGAAWEIPGGKKRKQKKNKRRDTQTIAMEGAQVDSTQLYQAVCSYNPILFSHSGRSTEELSLVEGDVVKPLTNVDPTGYLYAQVCGNKGLVPAAYLIPLNKAAAGDETKVDDAEDVRGRGNPENAPDKTEEDASISLSIADEPKDQASPTENFPSSGEPIPEKAVPLPPSKVFVQRVLSDFSILLGWTCPPLDDFGFCNGVRVKGYNIFVNDVLVEAVASPLQNKLLVDANSFPKRPYKNFGMDYLCFKVVSVSVDGVESPPSTCILEVGRGLTKTEAGSDEVGCGSGSVITPGEQPLTESEATNSEMEANQGTFPHAPSKLGPMTSSLTSSFTSMTSSLTSMTSSLNTQEEKRRRRKPSRPPSPEQLFTK